MTNDDPLMNDEETGEAVAKYLEENPELLDGFVPAHDLWPAIESRISARVIPITAAPDRFRRKAGWLPMLVAASALVAGSAGITYVLTMRSAAQAISPASVAATGAPMTGAPVQTAPLASAIDSQHVAQVVAPRQDETTVAHNDASAGDDRKRPAVTQHRAAAQLASHPSAGGNDEMRRTYDSEIATLHAALEARRAQLNPATVETIEQNLAVIDNAIRQSREALARDPNSRLLNDQLDRTLAKKTGLLRAAALLPAA
jgi:hypothetical protein